MTASTRLEVYEPVPGTLSIIEGIRLSPWLNKSRFPKQKWAPFCERHQIRSQDGNDPINIHQRWLSWGRPQSVPSSLRAMSSHPARQDAATALLLCGVIHCNCTSGVLCQSAWSIGDPCCKEESHPRLRLSNMHRRTNTDGGICWGTLKVRHKTAKSDVPWRPDPSIVNGIYCMENNTPFQHDPSLSTASIETSSGSSWFLFCNFGKSMVI